MENTENKIYKAIVGVMGDIGAISKGKTSQQNNFKYRGVDDVMNALHPLMVKHGVFVAPEVVEQAREDRVTTKGSALIYSICKVRYTFYADDGSSVTAATVGEGMDSGDKATNKAMATAFKYACFQVFCIPTEEMKDPDAESHEVKPAGGPKPNEALRDRDGDATGGGYACEGCGEPFAGFEHNGKSYTAADAYALAARDRGRPICRKCLEREKALAQGAAKLIDEETALYIAERFNGDKELAKRILAEFGCGKISEVRQADFEPLLARIEELMLADETGEADFKEEMPEKSGAA